MTLHRGGFESKFLARNSSHISFKKVFIGIHTTRHTRFSYGTGSVGVV